MALKVDDRVQLLKTIEKRMKADIRQGARGTVLRTSPKGERTTVRFDSGVVEDYIEESNLRKL